jgi:hypothetical protein
MADPPVSVLTVLDAGVDAILGGSSGWLHIPPGGYLNVTWLSKKECYRLTIDVTPGHPFDDAAPAFVAETKQRLVELVYTEREADSGA